jgi:hypothetical protein
MSEIITANSFNIKNINYGEPKVLDNGGRAIYVGYTGKPFLLQTPEMVAPFGLNKWSNDKGGIKYTLELSFQGKENREPLMALYNMLESLDKKFVGDALDNSTSWLKKKYSSLDVVEALYTPLIKFPKDKATGEFTNKYPPTFKVNVPFKETYECEAYNNARERINLDNTDTKGSKIACILQCMGVWVAGGKFGVSWKVLQLRIVPRAGLPKGYFAFKQIENDVCEDEADVCEDDITPPECVARGKPSNFVESSDDDGIDK